MSVSNGQLLLRQTAIASPNACGGIAVLLVIYGTLSAIDKTWSWPKLDTYATFISSLATLIATFFTAASVYFPPHTRSADIHSKRLVAPTMCLLVLVAMYFLFVVGPLPNYVVNGIAILGLVGGLFRLLPFSEEPGLKE
ncbi:MAG: hypothetical protein HYZ17_08365 [Betaproteobacteria bacterium]|nr:hypothetical protein [Betaproteobacteria bacterium]